MKRTSHCSCYRVFKQQLLGKSVNNKLAVSSTMAIFLKGTVMQIEKALINDRLRISKVSGKFRIPIIHNFAVI